MPRAQVDREMRRRSRRRPWPRWRGLELVGGICSTILDERYRGRQDGCRGRAEKGFGGSRQRMRELAATGQTCGDPGGSRTRSLCRSRFEIELSDARRGILRHSRCVAGPVAGSVRSVDDCRGTEEVPSTTTAASWRNRRCRSRWLRRIRRARGASAWTKLGVAACAGCTCPRCAAVADRCPCSHCRRWRSPRRALPQAVEFRVKGRNDV